MQHMRASEHMCARRIDLSLMDMGCFDVMDGINFDNLDY